MNSVKKAIYILKRLGNPPYEIGVTDIAKEMNIAKSGVHAILSELLRENLVVKNTSTKKYSLGPVVYRLGHIYSNSTGLSEISKSVMESISKLTGMSVFVGIREGLVPILAYKHSGSDGFLYEEQIGESFPFNASAMGKFLTAYLKPEEIEYILQNETFEKITPKSITNPETLRKDYELIRSQGFCVSISENRVGAFGIAFPIVGRLGNVNACLCMVGPLEQFVPEVREQWMSLLKTGAEEISYRLGFRNI